MKKRAVSKPVTHADLDTDAFLVMPKEYKYISLLFDGNQRATEPFLTFDLAKDGRIRKFQICNVGLGCLEETLEIFYKQDSKWWPGLIVANAGNILRNF